eukprot:CAMPEP_0194274740 /NCGR_PEP_ID=MMETSP0169-20130528/7748_1 /TAXON_ID=218684 /ORGANISM="Corethron pennatum, Strain L29A3" /LENGTH=273 /DNA_ID=CAMNT_0039018019 /DNA_START=355 /DNA_END=1176 /DNA_ORIENTATION=+
MIELDVSSDSLEPHDIQSPQHGCSASLSNLWPFKKRSSLLNESKLLNKNSKTKLKTKVSRATIHRISISPNVTKSRLVDSQDDPEFAYPEFACSKIDRLGPHGIKTNPQPLGDCQQKLEDSQDEDRFKCSKIDSLGSLDIKTNPQPPADCQQKDDSFLTITNEMWDLRCLSKTVEINLSQEDMIEDYTNDCDVDEIEMNLSNNQDVMVEPLMRMIDTFSSKCNPKLDDLDSHSLVTVRSGLESLVSVRSDLESLVSVRSDLKSLVSVRSGLEN